MRKSETRIVAKILYGMAFMAMLPILLILWAIAADRVVTMPVIPQQEWGWWLAGIGLAILFVAMFQLMLRGEGLPMNIAPPKKFVSGGMYAVFPHPIYMGFTVACFGLSWAYGSSAGLWLVSPSAALGCVALVWGYERIDLKDRFGTPRSQPLIHVAPDNDHKPQFSDKISVVLLLFAGWMLLYYVFVILGVSAVALNTVTAFEEKIPLIEWTVMLYSFVYPFAVAAPFFAKSNADARRFLFAGWWANIIIFLIYCAFPMYAAPRPVHAGNIFEAWIAFERGIDSPAAAFPSFHVFFAFLAAQLYASRFPKARHSLYILAALISLSCFTTGMHSIADIIAGYAVFVAVRNPAVLQRNILRTISAFANSWKEWRIGRIRIISHGFYAGLAGFTGVWIVGAISGAMPAAVIALCTLTGAGLWAQFLEGGSGLLRPFGYFGAIIGGVAAVGICTAAGFDFWQLFTACALCSPFVQLIGRLRCLVQGCCHGRECSSRNGLVYSSPQSRVVKAGLGGKSLYPTPLYSIVANVALGCVLWRMWIESAPYSSVAGIYFLGAGFTRFIEEAYRGEPQTASLGGLRVYQWLAVFFVVVGAVLTCLPTEKCTSFSGDLNAVGAALVVGIISFAFMGVDLPESNRRFSRLTI